VQNDTMLIEANRILIYLNGNRISNKKDLRTITRNLPLSLKTKIFRKCIFFNVVQFVLPVLCKKEKENIKVKIDMLISTLLYTIYP